MAFSISIFSRSGESEYRWLVETLRREFSQCSVSSFVITNRNYSAFCEEIYRCSIAILYHSKNRGRVNLTDVTDSLYDNEVRTMYEALGKDRVIVVIDDLDDCSHEVKTRILKHQPTLENQTRAIFLFTPRDKANAEVLRRKVEPIKRIISLSVPTDTEDQTGINVPERGPEEARPEMQDNTKKTVVSLLSLLVYWNTYISPGRANVLVAFLWAAVTGKVLYNSRSAVLPLPTQGRFFLSCTLTFLTVYNTFYRPSIFNVTTSALWISSCFMYSLPRHRQPLILRSGPFRMGTSYAPVLLTFWQGWQHIDDETTFQMISWFIYRTPAILAAEGI